MRKIEPGSVSGFAVERRATTRSLRLRAAGPARGTGIAADAPRLAARRRRGEVDGNAAPVGVRRLRDDRDVGVAPAQRRQRHAAEPGLIGLQRAASSRRAAAGRTATSENRSFIARAPPGGNRFCLARLPHTSISHQRRLLFLVASKNSQPHFSPWHCLTRVRSPWYSSVTRRQRDRPEDRLDRRFAHVPGQPTLCADRGEARRARARRRGFRSGFRARSGGAGRPAAIAAPS